MDALSLSVDCLPPVYPSTTVVGHVTADASTATGLAAGTPVVIGGGDGACAGVGAGVLEPGDAYCYIGASSWISIAGTAPVIDPAARIFTFHALHPERYAPMGTMQAAGAARDWAWRQLSADGMDLDIAAASVPPGAGGVLFLPYLLGERSPHWNPLARAAWLGMAMPSDKPQLARAVLEGVVFNLRLILDALTAQVDGIRRGAAHRRRQPKPTVAADHGRLLPPSDPRTRPPDRSDRMGRGHCRRRRCGAVYLGRCAAAGADRCHDVPRPDPCRHL